MRSVEVQATSKDVGAGESHERKLSSVCATANGFDFGSHLRHFHGFFRNVDDVHHGFHLLTHIIISIAEGELKSIVAIFGIHALHQSAEHRLAGFKTLAVVVANDEAQLRALHRSGEVGEVEETFVACGVFGGLKFGHLLHEFGG